MSHASKGSGDISRGVNGPGQAVSQAEVVHQGVVHDLEVDTMSAEAIECAQVTAARVK